MNDVLQHLLVVVHTLVDSGQIGQDTWQQILVVLRYAQKLALSPLDPLLHVGPDGKKHRGQQKKFTSVFKSR